MGDLRKEVFVCIDCETTGLDLEKDRIIEIAVVCFTLEREIFRFDALVDPEMPISEESLSIHHITAEMVQGKPKIAEVLPQVLESLGSHTIVGHGVGFDIEMTARAAKAAKIDCRIQNRAFIDTLRLARHYGESPVNSLSGLASHFHITYSDTHRALADVLLNIEVFRALTKRFRTTEEIFKLLSYPILMKIMPLGKHKGRPFSEIPLDYLRWAQRMDFDEDLHHSIKHELKKRSRGANFSQTANPFLDIDL